MTRLGVVGCGRIAERGYIPAALAVPGLTIAAFADPDRDRREGCLRRWREGGGEAGGFADLPSLLAAEPVDLLVIAAPLEHHLPLAEEAAAAAVPALVEKPPAPDLAGALRLAALEPEPMLAFNRRFLQGDELRESIPSEGWLELELELRFRRGDWGAHQVRDEALLDAGIHLLDLACHLTEAAPIAVRAAEVAPEAASLELELSRGRARISCATDRRHREAIAVRDRSGRLLASSTWGGLRTRLGTAIGRPDPLALSLQRQLEAARKRCDEGSTAASPIATAYDGAVAMAIVDATRRSAQLQGAEVTVAPLAGVSA